MGLKAYTLRLDEEEYEKLKNFLGTYGDPDMNVSFMLRRYIRDINKALPYLNRSEFNLLNMLAFYGSGLRQLFRTGELANLMEGTPIVERAQAEEDDRKAYAAAKKKVK